MRLIVLLVALALMGAGSSLAVGKAPPVGSAASCVRFDVKGTVDALGAHSFTIEVPGPKAHGAKAGPSTIVVKITSATQVYWTSTGTLAGPAVGEHVWAKGKRCGTIYTATWALFSTKQG